MISENKVKLNEETLFKAMAYISDDILIRSEQSLPKKDSLKQRITLLASMAAALFLISGTIFMAGILSGPNGHSFFNPSAALSGAASTSTGTSDAAAQSPNYNTSLAAPLGESKYPSFYNGVTRFYKWTSKYNKIDESASGDRAYVPGYFEEKLSSQQLDILKPDKIYDHVTLTGKAGYSGEGKLIDVKLNVSFRNYSYTFKDHAGDVTVRISESDILRNFATEGELLKSVCNGKTYTLYSYQSGIYVVFEANTEIDGLYYNFTVKAVNKNQVYARELLELTIDCFSSYEKAPDLSLITPSYLPTFENYTLPYESAKEDETFGEYLFETMPQGFTEESTRRYIDSDENYLSSLWTNGLNEISYKVTYYNEREMGSRFTFIKDEERYDLSLYPIPRGETVPENLMEVVNNPIFSLNELTLDTVLKRTYYVEDAGDVSGPRINFSVILQSENGENILVEIRSKGVDPEWLFNSLKKLA